MENPKSTNYSSFTVNESNLNVGLEAYSKFDEVKEVNFKSEKEFQNEMDNIINLTKDCSSDWKKRENALVKLSGIIKGNYSHNTEFLKILNSKLYLNLFAQISDLRSSLMKEACKTLVFISQVYRHGIENIAEKLFHANYLYKLLSSQNKVIENNVHNCMIGVLSNIQSGRVITKIYENYKSKSNLIRLRVCQQLYFCLNNYDPEFLDKHLDIFENCILKMTPDASCDVRVQARRIFFKYIEFNPEGEDCLLSKLPANVLKQLKEDQRKIDNGTYDFGNDVSCFKSFTSENSSINHSSIGEKSNTIKSSGNLNIYSSNLNKEFSNLGIQKDISDELVSSQINPYSLSGKLKSQTKEEMNQAECDNILGFNRLQSKEFIENKNEHKNYGFKAKKAVDAETNKSLIKSNLVGSGSIGSIPNIRNSNASNFNSSNKNEKPTKLFNKYNNNSNINDDYEEDIHTQKRLDFTEKEEKTNENMKNEKGQYNMMFFNNKSIHSPLKGKISVSSNLNSMNNQKKFSNKDNSSIQNDKTTIRKNSNSTSKTTTTSKTIKKQNTEGQINDILLKANKNDINSRIQAFELILLSFNEILSNFSLIHSQTREELVQCHLENLCLGVNKLTIQIMKNLTKFLFFLVEIFSEEDISKMVSLILLNLTIEDSLVVQTSNSVIDVLMQKVDSDVLIKPILENLSSSNSEEIRFIALDIFHNMINNIEKSLKNKEFLKELSLDLVGLMKINEKSIKMKIADIFDVVVNLHGKEYFTTVIKLNNESTQRSIIEFISANKPQLLQYKEEEKNTNNRNNLNNKALNTKFTNNSTTTNSSTTLNSNSNINIHAKCLALASEFNYDSFLNFLLADKNNLETFLFSITKVKQEQVEGVIFQLENILNLNYILIKDLVPLLFNRCLYLAERFSYLESNIINILDLIYKYCHNELFIQIATKYLNERNSIIIMNTILEQIADSIGKIHPESLLLLLPSFYENIVNCMNHSNSLIRKKIVLIIVDLYFIIGEDFEVYLANFTQTQRNLIDIYIDKRKKKI